jgi:hypothetical protein
MNAVCRLCNGAARPFGTSRILRRHDISWFRCSECGFVQTEEPWWLEEAYPSAITRSDLGLPGRNVRLAHVTAAVISAFSDPDGTFVDYAGGYGLLVRLLRDAGYDFRLLERYCENLFAAGFEAEPAGRYALLTAFEVVEHLIDPIAGFREMASLSDNILFSTVLLPADAPAPGTWWYYGPEHGQHIGIHTRESLRRVASTLGFQYVHDGRDLHLFSRRRVSGNLFRLICRHHAAVLFGWWNRRKSLLGADVSAMLRANGYAAEAESFTTGAK